MEAAIRFSVNSTSGKDQRFLHVDVTGKSFKLCRITSQDNNDVQHEIISSSTKAPAFRAFDWHPANEDLIVVGQSSGEAALLNIAEGQQDSLSFQVRSQRLCNAVALNSQNLLAAGLERVRTDFCLNIWDFSQRLPTTGSKGFSKSYAEPLHKLSAGEPITSIKFFQDDPQLLVAGVKGQFVRLCDLREPTANNGLQFATRCVHNLAIDWRNENYFASCYPTNDPAICLWDRRMLSRSNSTSNIFSATVNSETRSPEVSLELHNMIENPGAIWSLRFSKSKSGCLGALSSTGHLKVVETGYDYVAQHYQLDTDDHPEFVWRSQVPEAIYLDRAQDIEHNYSHNAAHKDEKSRIVSFDFMAHRDGNNQSTIITLDGNGKIKTTSIMPLPEPAKFSSLNYICKGRKHVSSPEAAAASIGELISQVKHHAEPRNQLRQSYKHSKTHRAIDSRKMSSFSNQAWYTDLGFLEQQVPVKDLLTLTSVQRLRCEAGYLFDPSRNIAIVSDSNWLQSLWNWIDRAVRLSKHGNMSQDNLDLSHLGVYALWMEDVVQKNRTLGPCSSRTSKIIENLVKRLNIPTGDICASEYPHNRQLCLHITGLAWSTEELEERTRRLIAQNQHSKAAALAIFAGQPKLAYKVLRVRSATQSHKMLAMAIAGAARRSKQDETGEDSDFDGDWSETIKSLADELTDPYARAILALVRSWSWNDVVLEESLPLKYRVGVALRHFDDSRLTRYISEATKDAVSRGDVEGIVLTGTATKETFELFRSYMDRFNDIQTAVLVLCHSIPRYLDDTKTVRKFNSWKQEYRSMMNSWGLKFDRVRFDIASQRLAVDHSGRRLIEPAKPQIRLVCGFCSGSIAHSENNGDSSNGSGEWSLNGRDRDSISSHPPNQSQSAQHSIHETAKNPLSSDKAAAIGTVCPRCGRHLPRCGICDLWLGVPDDTYLKWYGEHYLQKHKKGMDLGASLTGSIQTTIGPSNNSNAYLPNKGTDSPRPKQIKVLAARGGGSGMLSREGSQQSLSRLSNINHGTAAMPSETGTVAAAEAKMVDPEQDDDGSEATLDTAMSRFIVFCTKCSHGFHAAHARMWFQGRNGNSGHRICPVPRCSCVCYG